MTAPLAEHSQQRPAGRPIAILLHSFLPGGAQYRTIWLANRFVELGHPVDFLIVNQRGDSGKKLDPRVRVRLIAGGAGKPTGIRSLIAIWALSNYLRSERPYVFMSGANLSHALAIRSWRASARAVPVVLRLCSNAKLWPQDISPAALMRRIWGRNEELYGEASALIAVSHRTAEDFRRIRSIGSRPIDVIYNPTATADLLDRPLVRTRERPGDIPMILAAGTFYRAKDFPTLLRAFALVRRQGPARLVLMGEGQDKGKLEALAESLGVRADVDLPGWSDDLPSWIEQSSVVVSSSLSEGLPGTLIEALALGCPVVATDCKGASREILDGGTLGPLVPVGDHEKMAAAILDVLQSPPDPKRLREGARRFEESGKAEAYLQVFSRLQQQ